MTKKTSILLTVFLAVIVALGGGFAFWNFYLKDQDEGNKTKETQEESKKVEVPSNFKDVELNGVKIYYPEDWDDPEIEKTKEELLDEYAPIKSYSGELATFGNWDAVIYSLDAKSVKKDSSSDVSEALELLEDVYKNKTTEPEKVYSVSTPYIPAPMAVVVPYNPRYIESNSGEWRGFWYIANISNDISVAVNLVALMYNENESKVLTINKYITTKDSEKIQNKLLGTLEDWEAQSIRFEIEQYLKTAYFKDSMVKKAVDDEFLKVCQFVE